MSPQVDVDYVPIGEGQVRGGDEEALALRPRERSLRNAEFIGGAGMGGRDWPPPWMAASTIRRNARSIRAAARVGTPGVDCVVGVRASVVLVATTTG